MPTTFLVYGDSGVGKSTFAATFPKPALVIQTDPFAKAMPFKRKGMIAESSYIQTADAPGGKIYYDKIVRPKDEKLLFQIERYSTENIQGGSGHIYGYENLMARLNSIREEVMAGQWKTVIFDSLSTMEFEVRKLHQYKLNPESKSGSKQDARQWYAASTQAIEELCFSQLTWLPCNVVVLAHVREEKDNVRDTLYWTPAAPGAQGRRLPACFAEVYYMKKVKGEENESLLQTRANADYMATSQIPAPNPCKPEYKAVWEDFVKQQESDDES